MNDGQYYTFHTWAVGAILYTEWEFLLFVHGTTVHKEGGCYPVVVLLLSCLWLSQMHFQTAKVACLSELFLISACHKSMLLFAGAFLPSCPLNHFIRT